MNIFVLILYIIPCLIVILTFLWCHSVDKGKTMKEQGVTTSMMVLATWIPIINIIVAGAAIYYIFLKRRK